MTTLPNIGFIGRARTGKDTAAFILARRHDYTRLAFADPLRDLMGHLDPFVGARVRYNTALGSLGYEAAKDQFPEVRQLLQRLGTGARDLLGCDVWLDALLRRAELQPAGQPIAVTDVRFPNEADRLRALGFTLIRLTRTAAPVGDHISETALDGYPADVTYANDWDLNDLEAFLGAVVGGTTPQLERSTANA